MSFEEQRINKYKIESARKKEGRKERVERKVE